MRPTPPFVFIDDCSSSARARSFSPSRLSLLCAVVLRNEHRGARPTVDGRGRGLPIDRFAGCEEWERARGALEGHVSLFVAKKRAKTTAADGSPLPPGLGSYFELHSGNSFWAEIFPCSRRMGTRTLLITVERCQWPPAPPCSCLPNLLSNPFLGGQHKILCRG